MTRDPYRLMRYVATGALEGAIAGWVTLGLFLWFDVQGIGGLIDRVEGGQLMLWLGIVSFGVTFGMVGIAWRVMVLLPGEKGDGE